MGISEESRVHDLPNLPQTVEGRGEEMKYPEPKVVRYIHVRDGRADDEMLEDGRVEQGGFEIGGDY